jgi:hypothetical protein
MRRFLVTTVAALALFAGACGGGDGDKDNASNNSDGGNDTDNGAIAAASLASVCGGREAVSVGAAGASGQQSGSVNYDSIADNLRKAADAAPSDIKDDFRILVEAQIPFFEALADANGNYMTAYENSDFQEAAAKLSTEEVQTASKNISDWFASHCS